MDINLVRALVTLVSFTVFGAIAWWAYAPRNRARFERDAAIPFASAEERQS